MFDTALTYRIVIKSDHLLFDHSSKTTGNSRLIFYLAFSFAERVGVDVVECACVIELPELKV